MNIYLFDINRTLAPSGSNINSEFQTFFIDWMTDKHVILVTESEKNDTVSQIGEVIWTASKRVYQSNANIQYRGSTGPDAMWLSQRGANDRIKSNVLDDFDYYRTNHWNTCHVTYFGTDSQTIEKLENEWNTSNKTYTVHQPNAYTDTWDILK